MSREAPYVCYLSARNNYRKPTRKALSAMLTFPSALASVFTFDPNPPVLTVADEVAMIAAARSGDSEAWDVLLRAYGPLMRLSVRAAKSLPRDDAESVAVLAFAETLAAHDVEAQHAAGFDGRLAGCLSFALREALSLAQVAEGATFAVPKRTMVRYLSIMRRAEGDVTAAADSAPSAGMSREVFLAVHDAVAMFVAFPGSGDDDYASPEDSVRVRVVGAAEPASDFLSAEDALVASVALRALPDEDHRVVTMAYGFTASEDFAYGEPIPDAAIAVRLGTSRASVQRRRSRALDTMRKAVAVIA